MTKIPGGFILRARNIQKSKISESPPCVREIWDWILMNAQYKDTTAGKRGELFTKYTDIQEGLAWYVGWRKLTYTKGQVESAMKTIRKHGMITTRKTTRGLIITVVNYDKYQYIGNYEDHKENVAKTTKKTEGRPHYIEKKVKNVKESNEDNRVALAAPTPGQEATDFFESEEKQIQLIEIMVQKGIPADIAENEVRKFVLYWTEPNKTGKQLRWEKEPTFDVKRRIVTWLSRVKTGNSSKQPSKSINL